MSDVGHGVSRTCGQRCWVRVGGLASLTMITSPVRRRRGLPLFLPLVLGLLAVLLAGCSSGSAHGGVLARPSSSLRVSATASATPTPAPSPSSAAAVEAGVRAWFAAVNVAFASGDTKALREHTEQTCACLNLARMVEATWAHGEIRGLTWTLSTLHVLRINYHVASVQLDIDETTYQVLESGKHYAPHRADHLVVLSQFALKNGVWRMWNYSQTSVSPR